MVKIRIVDDDTNIRALMRLYLKNERFNLVEADKRLPARDRRLYDEVIQPGRACDEDKSVVRR
ncbi:hypothetical protein [Paenibacillus pabuli]|uniref:hypothetical protein n=1 Tax=Paenibacillus pabuli TaxID=1472 RepID=UPI002069E3C9|nr:hypothetical protein [Paenibacillus pabuli]UPK41336.1 hypothetical protein KET34_18825 [Paenibacillus pabuli]